MIKNKHIGVLHITKILFTKIREGQFWWGVPGTCKRPINSQIGNTEGHIASQDSMNFLHKQKVLIIMKSKYLMFLLPSTNLSLT